MSEEKEKRATQCKEIALKMMKKEKPDWENVIRFLEKSYEFTPSDEVGRLIEETRPKVKKNVENYGSGNRVQNEDEISLGVASVEPVEQFQNLALLTQPKSIPPVNPTLEETKNDEQISSGQPGVGIFPDPVQGLAPIPSDEYPREKVFGDAVVTSQPELTFEGDDEEEDSEDEAEQKKGYVEIIEDDEKTENTSTPNYPKWLLQANTNYRAQTSPLPQSSSPPPVASVNSRETKMQVEEKDQQKQVVVDGKTSPKPKTTSFQSYEDVFKLVRDVEMAQRSSARNRYPYKMPKCAQLSREYLKKFPNHIDGAAFLKKAVTYVKVLGVLKGMMEKGSGNSVIQNFTRFGVLAKLEDITANLNGKDVGDPIDLLDSTQTRKVPYRISPLRNFSCVAPRKLTFKQGETHVAIGFLDLIQLLHMKFVKVKDGEPFKYVGYEANVFSVARMLIIVELLSSPSMGKYNKDELVTSALDIWFSSVWSQKTLEIFLEALNGVLSQTQDGKVLYVLNHWKTQCVGTLDSHVPGTSFETATAMTFSPDSYRSGCKLISASNARKEWMERQKPDQGIVKVAFNLKRRKHRVELARYILSGELNFGKGEWKKINPPKWGNPTFFNSPYSTNTQQIVPESVLNCIWFFDVKLDKIEGDPSLLQVGIKQLHNGCLKLQKLLAQKFVKIELNHIFISPSDVDTCKEIKERLKPSSISWSNLCDFMPRREYQNLVKLCSPGPKTQHFAYSFFWNKQVFGVGIMDFPSVVRKKVFVKQDGYFKRVNEDNALNEFLLEDPLTSHGNRFTYAMCKPAKMSKNWLQYQFSLVDEEKTLGNGPSLVRSLESYTIPFSVVSLIPHMLYFSFRTKIEIDDPLRTCANCGNVYEKKSQLKRCGRCKAVCYCSKECQRAHWKVHKKECRS